MDREPINLPISETSFVGSEAVDLSLRPRVGQILSGPERRRRWSYEEKSRIVAESLAPGASAAQVASRYGLHPNQLYGWRKELRCATTAGAEIANDFVPVEITGTPVFARGTPIEIAVAGTTVRAVPGVEMSFLAAVLRTVKTTA
jgi:transposase